MLQHSEWPKAGWSIWAKSGDPTGWLSLPQHMIDSSQVGEILWTEWVAPSQRRLVEEDLTLTETETLNLVSWLTGSHDVGKADSQFLRQVEDRRENRYLVDQVIDAGLPLDHDPQFPDKIQHSTLGAAIVSRHLRRYHNVPEPVARTLASIAGAHHGLPASHSSFKYASQYLDAMSSQWVRLHTDLLNALADDTGATAVLPRLRSTKLSPQTQMLITGLTIMTDWITSNPEACPLSSTGRSSSTDRARTAVNAIRPTAPWNPLLPNTGTAKGDYSSRFNWPAGRSPHPSQSAALDMCRALEPHQAAMLVIEAPMGEGKTEGALLSSEFLAQRSGASGVMVATPTTATADGLLARVARWAESTTIAVRPLSLFLAHSRSKLNPDMKTLRFQGIGTDEVHAPTIAHQWLSGRKKGILANAVIGTVDQVLFMALQSKHIMLRHLGLSSKVIIIDECHAYDTYMSAYLSTALRWLGKYGAPVILLSATLPASKRRELIDAYREGLDIDYEAPGDSATQADGVGESSYPRLTLATQSGEQTVTPPPSGNPTVIALSTIDDEAHALRTALLPTRDTGGCTAVVCSTVARAQDAFRLAQELVGDDAVLLHAQFTASHRMETERRLLRELGPGAARQSGRPQRRIIVATQVIEQSLDIDLDHLITDIAPADLILQRTGRLHRHPRNPGDRPDWASTPHTVIRGFRERVTPEKAPAFAPGIDAVYPEPLLLSSITALELDMPEPRITVPTDIPVIVHSAYEDPSVHTAWQEHYDEARQKWDQKERTRRMMARSFQITSPDFGTLTDTFVRHTDVVDDGTQLGEQQGLARVRDADPSIEVIPVISTGTGYAPIPLGDDDPIEEYIHHGVTPHGPLEHQLAASTLRLPARFTKIRDGDDDPLDLIVSTLEQLTDPAWMQSSLLRGQLMLPFDDNLRTQLVGHDLEYDLDLGLVDHTYDAWRAEMARRHKESHGD